MSRFALCVFVFGLGCDDPNGSPDALTDGAPPIDATSTADAGSPSDAAPPAAALDMASPEADAADASPSDAALENELAGANRVSCRAAQDLVPAIRFPEATTVALHPANGRPGIADGLLVRWILSERPPASEYRLFDDGAYSFEFEPDVPGLYRFCALVVDDEDERTTCCSANYIESFEGRALPEPTETSPEWLLLEGGWSIRWGVNERWAVSPEGTRIDAPANWGRPRRRDRGGQVTAEGVFLEFDLLEFSNLDPVPGDRISVELAVLPLTTATPDSWLRAQVDVVDEATLAPQGPPVESATLSPGDSNWELRVHAPAADPDWHLYARVQGANGPALFYLSKDEADGWWSGQSPYSPPNDPVRIAVISLPQGRTLDRHRWVPREWGVVGRVEVLE